MISVKPNWRDGNGRPSKEQLVKKWKLDNPHGKKIDCHRDTGLDPKTIRNGGIINFGLEIFAKKFEKFVYKNLE